MNQLDQLYEQQNALNDINNELSQRRAEIMAQVADQISALECEYAPLIEAAQSAVLGLTNEIKADALAGVIFSPGEHLRVVYVKGRATWDTKALDGFAAAHPEIAQFRSVGEPSVRIQPRTK